MGKKISIDSSTLLNKVFELIEAQKIFDLPSNKFEIIIHPNSLVHAIVKYKNGLVKFLYHETTMIIPLANAIFDGKLIIKDFYKIQNKKMNFQGIPDLILKNLIKKYFQLLKS